MSSKLICPALAVSLLLAYSPAQAQFLEADVTVLATMTAENAGDQFGWVAESVGDIDDDGVSDYVIGAPSFGANGSLQGRAYVYSGATHTLLHTHTGAPGDRIGFGIAPAGDANCDGVLDYAISGPGTFGSGHPGRLLILSGADHGILQDVAGEPGSFFGYDINLAGDVDNDYYDDIIVGSLLGGPDASGRVQVISGADGATLWSRDGATAGGRFGSGVSSVGDLDGDHIPEQAVGAFADGDAGTGLAYVLTGDTGEILFTLTRVTRLERLAGSLCMPRAMWIAIPSRISTWAILATARSGRGAVGRMCSAGPRAKSSGASRRRTAATGWAWVAGPAM